ncbi:MAG: rRNA maturation RNase YbeY [Paracoccaceae bacterium]
MPDIADCVIEDARWDGCNLAVIAERATRAALAICALQGEDWEAAILACDDARIATLNGDFRGKPVATNVLSWPAQALAPSAPGEEPLPPEGPELGDIAIAFETCEGEARDQGIEFAAHVAHLIVHAVLHLLGYDHIEDADATVMEGLEIKALASMGIQNPY